MPKTFAVKLSEDDARRLEALLGERTFGGWVRETVNGSEALSDLQSRLEALRGEAASASAEVEAQAARKAELLEACRAAVDSLAATEGQRGEVEQSAAAVIEELGQQAAERLEGILDRLTGSIETYGQLREKLADELPMAAVLKAMSATPETVAAQEAGSILARVALWSSKGGLNPAGPPPEVVSRGSLLLGVSRLSFYDLCRWGLFLLGPPEEGHTP